MDDIVSSYLSVQILLVILFADTILMLSSAKFYVQNAYSLNVYSNRRQSTLPVPRKSLSREDILSMGDNTPSSLSSVALGRT
jgi:hypothetical protein